MSKITQLKKAFKYLTNKHYRDIININTGKYDHLSDEDYIKKAFKVKMGYEIDLDYPKTFNEKLQWLKLHDRKPIYTTMVDKFDAKKYVADIIGEQYIIPTYGIWDSFDEIDFSALPDQFVLKCTHDSGGLIICRNKSELDINAGRAKINKSLTKDYYLNGREWPYKDVKPRIIAEAYMQDGEKNDLNDYKFYCFNGNPEFLYISRGLSHHPTANISYLTLDWKLAEFIRPDYKPFKEVPEKPKNFDLMVEFAKKLSQNIPFLRVDFYEINGNLYFGELTFFPGSGFTKFEPDKFDLVIGKKLLLPID